MVIHQFTLVVNQFTLVVNWFITNQFDQFDQSPRRGGEGGGTSV